MKRNAAMSLATGVRPRFRASVRARLERHPTLWRVAHGIYFNGQFLQHVAREGLWPSFFRYGRPKGWNHFRQVRSFWEPSIPGFGQPEELAAWLRSERIRFAEGGHTFYLPPQSSLIALLPEIVAFYPEGTGFKIVKDFRPPDRARYLNDRQPAVHVRIVGSLDDQVPAANYLFALGIGPRIWDLACWRCGGSHYHVFAMEHVEGRMPSEAECLDFQAELRRLRARTHLRMLYPHWDSFEDFCPPDCNGNLVHSVDRGKPLYVDFQNLGMKSPTAWTLSAIRKLSQRNSGAGFNELLLNGARGRFLGSWRQILGMLQESSVDIADRMVIDLACQDGLAILAALASGAGWAVGMRSGVASLESLRDLILSMGATRFDLLAPSGLGIGLTEVSLEPRLQRLASEAVVLSLDGRMEPGFAEELAGSAWRALVVRGTPNESIDSLTERLTPAIRKACRIKSTTARAGRSDEPSPLLVAVRE